MYFENTKQNTFISNTANVKVGSYKQLEYIEVEKHLLIKANLEKTDFSDNSPPLIILLSYVNNQFSYVTIGKGQRNSCLTASFPSKINQNVNFPKEKATRKG